MRTTALTYVKEQWSPIPIPYKQKAPIVPEWQKLRIEEKEISKYFHDKDQNIGVLLGDDPSNGLTDIDLDCDEAISLAHSFLPDTPSRFGRKSRPGSHWLYQSRGLNRIVFADTDGSVLVEIRANGCQTVFPPSVHPSGEEIKWEGPSITPSEIGPEDLTKACGILASSCLLARHWPLKGSRNKFQMVLAGTLLRAGWERDTAITFIQISGEAGGGDPQAVSTTVDNAKEKLDSNQAVYGIPQLAEELGNDVVKLLVKWLTLKPPTKSFSELMNSITLLTTPPDRDQLHGILADIKSADITALDEAMLLKEIKEQTTLAVGILSQSLRELRSSGLEDIDPGLHTAQRTLDIYFSGGDYLVRAADRSFWYYADTHWVRITDEMVKNKVLVVIESEITGEGDIARLIDSAFKIMIARQATSSDKLRLTETPPPVINCQNGELWISEDGSIELKKHNHKSYLTYVLDIEYDSKAKAPIFYNTMYGIFQKIEPRKERALVCKHILEMIGYTIQPQRDLAAWFLWYGGGNNGKSKLVETIEKLLNREAIYSNRIGSIENDKFAIGSLVGKLLLLDDDVDEGTKIPDGFLKKLSERKLLSGQLKFKDSFQFIAGVVPLLLVNNWPRCSDLSEGIRRRSFVVPFQRHFVQGKDEDPKIFPKIWREELPGVLNLVIKGLQRLRRRGQFKDPESCREAKRQWLYSANPLMTFIQEGCHHNMDMSCSLTVFYDGYKRWANEAGVKYIQPRNTIKNGLIGLSYGIKTLANGGAAVVGLKPYNREDF